MKVTNREIKECKYKDIDVGESFDLHTSPTKSGHHCIKLSDGKAVDLQLCEVVTVDDEKIVFPYRCKIKADYIYL